MGGGGGDKKRTHKRGENEYENNDIQILFKTRCTAEATGSGHVSYLLCPDPRCKHYLDENVALLLQATEENNIIK